MVEQSPCAASHLWGGELTANSDLDLYAEPKYLCPNGVVIHRPCSCAEAAIKILYKIMQALDLATQSSEFYHCTCFCFQRSICCAIIPIELNTTKLKGHNREFC